MTVKTGLQVWVEQEFSALRGMSVGAIVNPTSVDSKFRHMADLLAMAKHVKLKALFGPEHGVRGQAQYMEAVESVARDRKTGVPIYSLYGHSYESLTPKAEWLQGLDALVFDIQDVGSRYYTYVYTMALAMKVAAKVGLPMYVLDRPNPLNGETLEGNLVQEGFESFVGLYPIPNRHGMTAAELASWFNAHDEMKCDLRVVPMQGWTREMYWSQTQLPFVPPSPNMPTSDTALVYPGMCLLEGTNVSEGRGTCRPFEQFGAPWLHADELTSLLNEWELPGVRFRAVAFTPSFDKYRGISCEGAMMHVADRHEFRPYLTGLAVVKAAIRLGKGHFHWRADAYEFVEKIPAFDLLAGNSRTREQLEADASLRELTLDLQAQEEAFRVSRKPHLIY